MNTLIQIIYNNDTWDFRIEFGGKGSGKSVKAKRKTKVKWICASNNWMVFFKGLTPLVDQQGKPVAALGNGAGLVDWAWISETTTPGEVYPYGVMVDLGGGDTAMEDPEIIIDNDNLKKAKARMRFSRRKRR